MKKILAFAFITLCLLGALTGCGQKNAADSARNGSTGTTQQAGSGTGSEVQAAGDSADSGEMSDSDTAAQTISGIVNRVGDYLVLLDAEGEYRIFDFGGDVDASALEEGSSVTVTYTGTLGSENPAPVATAIEAAE